MHYSFIFSDTTVADPCYMINGQKILHLNLDLNPGNSGAPVFDTNGNVVGMTTFAEINQDKKIIGHGFCVRAIDIINEMEGVN